jgi:hypothetical protein
VLSLAPMLLHPMISAQTQSSACNHASFHQICIVSCYADSQVLPKSAQEAAASRVVCSSNMRLLGTTQHAAQAIHFVYGGHSEGVVLVPLMVSGSLVDLQFQTADEEESRKKATKPFCACMSAHAGACQPCRRQGRAPRVRGQGYIKQ